MDELEQSAAKMKRMNRRHDLVMFVFFIAFVALGTAVIMGAPA